MESRSLFDSAIKKAKYWPVVECCYSKTWKEFRMPPHIHERVELMYVLKGKCQIHFFDYVEDKTMDNIRIVGRKVEKMSIGDFVLVDQGVLHALEVPDNSYMANIEFAIRPDETTVLSIERLSAASDAFENLLNLNRPVIRGVDREGQLYEVLAQVISGFSNVMTSNNERVLQDLKMGQLLLTLAQEVKMTMMGMNSLAYVNRAMQLLNERLEEQIRIADIAEEIGIAPSYLQRLFKQVKGVSMIDYLNSIRIKRSKFLLIKTKDSIVDIAVAVGYNSRQHFCRVFTQTVGMSPQKYRQINQSYKNTQLYMFENVRDRFVAEMWPSTEK